MAQRRFLDRVLRRGTRRTPGRIELEVAPGLPERDVDRIREIISDVLRLHDAMTQRAEAAAVADAYLTLSDEGRRKFLHLLATEFWTDHDAVDDAIRTLQQGGNRIATEQNLRDALAPRAVTLLRLFTGLDDGVKFLVDLRGDVLRVGGDDDALSDLSRELKAHLATLFDVGLLTLRRITWDAPASLLEKLIEYEAVHAIQSWDDLKNRLDSDRRCYAFFHPAMPNEPLVFVEVALTTGIATRLPPLLDTRTATVDVDRADTAVFYSISNCQRGLAGVNLGTALIKQVVEALRFDLPQLDQFVTLSPIPGFRRWLEETLTAGTLSNAERELLPAEPARVLARLGDPDWSVDEAIQPPLLALCARYLTAAPEGRVGDPVANFHLSNGATVERVDWMADPSPTGQQRSFGLMVNYLYDDERINERAEDYVAKGEVTMSSAVKELLAG